MLCDSDVEDLQETLRHALNLTRSEVGGLRPNFSTQPVGLHYLRM